MEQQRSHHSPTTHGQAGAPHLAAVVDHSAPPELDAAASPAPLPPLKRQRLDAPLNVAPTDLRSTDLSAPLQVEAEDPPTQPISSQLQHAATIAAPEAGIEEAAAADSDDASLCDSLSSSSSSGDDDEEQGEEEGEDEEEGEEDGEGQGEEVDLPAEIEAQALDDPRSIEGEEVDLPAEIAAQALDDPRSITRLQKTDRAILHKIMQYLDIRTLSLFARSCKLLRTYLDDTGAAYKYTSVFTCLIRDLPLMSWPRMRFVVWLDHTVDCAPLLLELARLQALILEGRVKALIIRAGHRQPVLQGDKGYDVLIPFFRWLGGRSRADRPPLIRLISSDHMWLPYSMLPLVTSFHAHSLRAEDIDAILDMPHLIDLRLTGIGQYELLRRMFNTSPLTEALRTSLLELHLELPESSDGEPLVDVPFSSLLRLSRLWLHIKQSSVTSRWLIERLKPELERMPTVRDLRIRTTANSSALLHINILLSAWASITRLTVELDGEFSDGIDESVIRASIIPRDSFAFRLLHH
jgi:hypothetical protein